MLSNTAVRRLCLYNLFNGLAIAPACNLAFMDKLMLHMELELSFIGYVKGIMYLAPAILYFLLVPILQRLHADVKIVSNCYVIRASLPAILPILALVTSNKIILTAACIFVLSAAMTLAGFANNSLMAIYRLALPKESFNRASGWITLFTLTPAPLMGLPLAWILDQCDGAPRYWFYIVFAAIHILCTLFEIPAIKNLLQLPPLKYPPTEKHHRIPGAFWKPFRDREYSPLLGLCFLSSIIYGIGTAYLFVYLLQERNYSMALLSTISLLLCISSNMILPFAGRLTDRIGYRKLFFIFSGALMAGHILFCIFWEKAWVMIPFAILTWTGSGSIVGGILGWGLTAAGNKHIRPSLSNNYIAAYSLCTNGGFFAGALIASFLLTYSKSLGGEDVYQRYFLLTLFFPVLLFLCSALYRFSAKKRKEKTA